MTNLYQFKSKFRFYMSKQNATLWTNEQILKLNQQTNTINMLSTPEKHVNVFSVSSNRGVYSVKIT